VRASYSLLHSPFFCRFLSENATESRALQFRLGLTMEASRVTPFLNNHVPEDEFNASPARNHSLKLSHVGDRSFIERLSAQFARHPSQCQSTTCFPIRVCSDVVRWISILSRNKMPPKPSHFSIVKGMHASTRTTTMNDPDRHRRKITAQIEVEQRSVLGSENLREYATKLAKGYSQAHE
jgi:hypothetical protein